MKRRSLALLGGVFDGDGSVFWSNTERGSLTATVTLNDSPAARLVLDDFKHLLGGGWTLEQQTSKLVWRVQGDTAERALRRLAPYLIVKRPKTLLAIGRHYCKQEGPEGAPLPLLKIALEESGSRRMPPQGQVFTCAMTELKRHLPQHRLTVLDGIEGGRQLTARERLDYATGLFEAEGHITVCQQGAFYRIDVAWTQSQSQPAADALDIVHKLFGGCRKVIPPQGSTKPAWSMRLGRAGGFNALCAMLPSLGLKADQAALLLRLLSLGRVTADPHVRSGPVVELVRAALRDMKEASAQDAAVRTAALARLQNSYPSAVTRLDELGAPSERKILRAYENDQILPSRRRGARRHACGPLSLRSVRILLDGAPKSYGPVKDLFLAPLIASPHGVSYAELFAAAGPSFDDHKLLRVHVSQMNIRLKANGLQIGNIRDFGYVLRTDESVDTAATSSRADD